MLSKKEIEFLQNPLVFSKPKRRYLRWTIRKKLRILSGDLAIILERCEMAGISRQEAIDSLHVCRNEEAFENLQTKPSEESQTFADDQAIQNGDAATDDSVSKYENW